MGSGRQFHAAPSWRHGQPGADRRQPGAGRPGPGAAGRGHLAQHATAAACLDRDGLSRRGQFGPGLLAVLPLAAPHRPGARDLGHFSEPGGGVDLWRAVPGHQTCEQLKIKKEIEVIYNFIDFARFSRLNKEHFRKAIAPDGEKILVHISNFRKVKRIEDAIKTFEIVQKKVPSKLLLVGDGPERPRLERMTRELGLYEHVRFLGKQDAVEEILAVADLFLIPSSNESFGLAALEAMACEVPVISSNAGGLPEVNIHGVTGCVADVGDYEAMAAHALMLLEDESLLKQYSHNALMQARKFDISIVLPQYEAYYEKVVSRFMASGKKNKLSLTA